MNQMYQSFVCITCHLLQKDSVRIKPKSITTPTLKSVWHRQLLRLRFGIVKLVLCIQSIYHIFHIYSQYHHFISPPPKNKKKSNQALQWPNPTWWRPRVQAYYLVIPCLSRSLYIMVVYFSICSCGIMRIPIPWYLPYLIQAVSTCKWLYQVRFCVAVQADTCIILNHNSTLLQYGCAMGIYSWSTHDHSSGWIMIIVITKSLGSHNVRM